MNENNYISDTDVYTDNDLLVGNETNLEQTETDTLDETDVSGTESVTVPDTSLSECLFTDTNIIAKLDIIIMLLIVMITISLFKSIRRMPNKMIPKKEK